MRNVKHRSKVWEFQGQWNVAIEFTCNDHGIWYKCWLEERRHKFLDDEYIYVLRFPTKEEADRHASVLLERITSDYRNRCEAPKVAESLAEVRVSE